MSTYMKRFVMASLFYLGLAAIFGILNSTTNIGYYGYFAHSHFNLLGFMLMMVFGIGYFILPRFNGTELRFENWVPVHFWLANSSLVGMVIFRGISVETGDDLSQVLFIICASLQVISIFMFIINIWITLSPKSSQIVVSTLNNRQSNPERNSLTQTTQQPSLLESSKPNVSVTPDSKIAELVDQLPSLQQTLVQSGLNSLQMPGHLDKVRSMGITIGMAAQNHGLDLDKLILKIEQELQQNDFTTRVDMELSTSIPSVNPSQLTSQTLIGDVIENYPQTRDVFQKYFGDGCFDCPGQAYESIDLACRMHAVNPDIFLKEINEVISHNS